MPATYTVKVPTSWPRIDSAQARAYLQDHFARGGGAAIGLDPGAGDRVLRLSLPGEQVEALAAALSESPAVALRRLIATRLQIKPGVSVEPSFQALWWLPATKAAQPTSVRPTGGPPTSWFERHPILTLLLLLAAAVLLFWLLFIRRRGGMPSAPQPTTPRILVSDWRPLQ
jgi:hypothetical protein